MNYHIAQLNLAKARYPLTDVRMKEFVELLAKINALGERSPGFIWILKDETGTAINFNLFSDPLLLLNMTVWKTISDLKNFAYQGDHGNVFRRRREWFDPMEKAHAVLWWIKAGHIPTVTEGKEKMEMLWQNGSTPAAFTLKKIFDYPKIVSS